MRHGISERNGHDTRLGNDDGVGGIEQGPGGTRLGRKDKGIDLLATLFKELLHRFESHQGGMWEVVVYGVYIIRDIEDPDTACYWFEQVAPRRLFDKVGVDNIMFETDFPHPTSLYGDEIHDRIEHGLADCDDDTRHKILWGNAQKLYRVEAPTAADEARLTSM